MNKEQILPTPHCPNTDVTLCAVGACYTEVRTALEQLNICSSTCKEMKLHLNLIFLYKNSFQVNIDFSVKL